MRNFVDSKLLIASHNQGKIRELITLLSPFNIEVVSAKHLNIPEPEETGKTFEENALLKAVACTKVSGFPSLADDSGLVIPILGGQPGIYSARWAKSSEGLDFNQAMARVQKELTGKEDLSAYFVCALCLSWPDGYYESFEGRVYGRLTFPPRGEKGFGYDPIFIPNDHKMTFGEMDPDLKHRLSHRAHAFEQLIQSCFSHFKG